MSSKVVLKISVKFFIKCLTNVYNDVIIYEVGIDPPIFPLEIIPVLSRGVFKK